MKINDSYQITIKLDYCETKRDLQGDMVWLMKQAEIFSIKPQVIKIEELKL